MVNAFVLIGIRSPRTYLAKRLDMAHDIEAKWPIAIQSPVSWVDHGAHLRLFQKCKCCRLSVSALGPKEPFDDECDGEFYGKLLWSEASRGLARALTSPGVDKAHTETGTIAARQIR